MSKNRSDILNFFLHLHPQQIRDSSAKFTHTFGLGGLALFAFLVTAATGILLLFAYSPTPETANSSMHNIASVMPYGWYIRNLHYWAGQVMVTATVLHMVRIVSNGGYLGGRALNWIIGIALLVLVFLMDFTGYSLRWDVDSNNALLIGINLIEAIPVIGIFLCSLLLGGTDIRESTLLHLYGWHACGLPAATMLFMAYHFYRIRRDGGISGKFSDTGEKSISRETLLKKEIIFLLTAAGLFMILSLAYTPELGLTPETGPGADAIKAPWIFLWIQFLLRHFGPFAAGIIIPAAVLTYWASLPYQEKNLRIQGVWFAAERVKCWLPFIISVLVICMLSVAETLVRE